MTFDEALQAKAEIAAVRQHCNELEIEVDQVLSEYGMLVYPEVQISDDNEVNVLLYEVDCSTDVVN